jgi:hypothetical protein
MKYQRLTREQFEALHKEFATFLATQEIDAKQWEMIKINQPEIAEQELDLFSDMIWDGVIGSISYLDHRSPQHLFLFKIDADQLRAIVVEIQQPDVDLQTTEGLNWLEHNIRDKRVGLYTSAKPFGEDKHTEVFKIIQQGADISKGELYGSLERLLP